MWFWFSLTSAVLGAFESIFNKRTLNKVDPVIFTWVQLGLSLPILAFLAFRNGIPPISTLFVIGALSAGAVFVLSKNLSNNVLKKGNLSQVIPLNVFTVFFTFIFGEVFLGEKVSLGGILGLVLIGIGAYVMNAESARESLLKPIKILFSNKLVLLYVLAMLLSSLEGILMKTSLNNTVPTNVALAMFTEQTVMILILTPYLFKFKQNIFTEIRGNTLGLIISSLFYVTITYLSFTAISTTSVVLAQGVKRSQILFALLLGIIFLHDKPTKYVWAATIIMILGVIIVKTST